MAQRWHDLLFAHWPVNEDQLRPLIPDCLEVETFDGAAWLGIVPFRMSGIRLRGTPPIPGLSAFPELNVRTYVRDRTDGKPGVWFLSLDAANRVAVAVARRCFHLPYFRARMSCEDLEGQVVYTSQRIHGGAPAAGLSARYGPTGPVTRASPGSLDHWLVERYCLYAHDQKGQLWRGHIDHAPWPLQPAKSMLEHQGLASGWGVTLPDRPPLLHFARHVDVRVWPLERVRQQADPMGNRRRL